MAEKWLVEKARKSKDGYARESWMLIAKTMLATGSYDLCVSMYDIYFQRRNAAEAAETLQKLYMKYSNDQRFWEEAVKLIQAIEPKVENEETKFRREVFHKLLPELQQSLFLDLADRTKEVEEKCRQYLICLRMFPDSIAAYGIELVRILRELSGKEEATTKREPVDFRKNYYANVLVTKVVPALLKCRDLPVQEDIFLSLLRESILFYTVSAVCNATTQQDASKLEQSDFENLALVLRLAADRFDWQLAKTFPSFKLDDLKAFLKNLRGADRERMRPETHFSALVTLGWLVSQYLQHPETGVWHENKKQSVLLVIPQDINDTARIERLTGGSPKNVGIPKKRKLEFEKFPFLEKHLNSRQLLEEIFEVALNCWELLFIKKGLIKEVFGQDLYVKVRELLTDAMVYQQQHEECAAVIEKHLETIEQADQSEAQAFFKLSSCCFALNRLNEAKKYAIRGLEAYTGELSSNSDSLDTGEKIRQNCMVYLDLKDSLAYLVRIFMNCLAGSLSKEATAREEVPDEIIGHLIVLSQLNWPRYRHVFSRAVEVILERKNFTYPGFFNYVRHLDIMEEVAYLSTNYDKLNLNITETEAARKSGLMNTRHSSKGAKDEIRQLLEIAARTYTPAVIPDEVKRFLIEQKAELIE